MNLIFWIVLVAYASLVVEIVVFPIPSVVSTAQLAKPGSGNRLTRMGHGLSGLLAGASFVLPLLLVIFPPLARLAYPLVEPVPVGFIVAGLLLILGGRIFSLGAVLSMRRGLGPFRGEEPTTLHTRHFFRLSRNPILLGMFLMYAGLMALLPHAILLPFAAIFALHMHRKVLLEERHLERHYGSAFVDYRARTRRYL